MTAGEVSGRSLRTAGDRYRLQRYRGHLFNRYDTRMLDHWDRSMYRRSKSATVLATCYALDELEHLAPNAAPNDVAY